MIRRFNLWRSRRQMRNKIERRIAARQAQQRYWRDMDRRLVNVAAHIAMENRLRILQRALDPIAAAEVV